LPLWLLPALVTLAAMAWRIGQPSYSRDEAATLSAVQRPFPALLRMLTHVDVVHGAYYLALWPVVRLAGAGELATRLPSALAMAAAAAAVTGLGRRLLTPRAGLAAGLVFATLPCLSLYGQTARPYGMVTALAVAASYLLMRAMQAAAAGSPARGWLAKYAACLAALGYMHPFALLLAAAHAVPIGRAWLRRAGDTARRSLAAGWLATTAAAFTLVSPLLIESTRQRVTLAWARTPAIRSITGLTGLIGPRQMAVAVGLAMLPAIAARGLARWRPPANHPGGRKSDGWAGGGPAGEGHGALLALCLPWLVLPPAILIACSLVTPVYVFRYVVFCAPAAALLAGAGLAALGWAGGAAVLAIITMLAVPAQLQLRSGSGHGDDIRAADQIIARDIEPGDVLWYNTIQESIGPAYPYGLRQLRNVAVALPPAQAGTLGGTWAPGPVVRHRVAVASRVWLAQLAQRGGRVSPRFSRELRALGFRLNRTWLTRGVELSLYQRVSPQAPRG
jgi:mannosyltransferase